jgi:glutamate synthase domain-containing protein 1/glutamate synthase domain-containing protein 3
MNNELMARLLQARARLVEELGQRTGTYKGEEEGGCGVVGFCASEPMAARHIYEPSRQMHNRGNGKGGGIAAVGFIPEQLGVTRQVLDDYYMVHIAYLDPAVRPALEQKYLHPNFEIHSARQLETVEDWKTVPDLEVRPPDVWRYFARIKPGVLDAFIESNKLAGMPRDEAEAEFFNQNGIRLNQEYYASLGEKKAFVLSQGKDMMILKVVGYAEAITRYYRIDELRAHAWIAHQRFPTKGRVWHPAGAHPFGAINTALVHNGDFANYHSVSEYLAQRHIYPQFLTDTEVAVQLFDLLERTYHYPLEFIIEALAPTTEFDFDRLSTEKQALYRQIQATHIHGSPDGPWFFIIARNLPREKKFQLMGITDTSMLRPQVFAFHDGEVQVGLICSEKQAIDATLLSMSREDKRICPVADRYWNARGGSSTDGGAFIFELKRDAAGRMRLACADKFGQPVALPAAGEACDFNAPLNGHLAAMEGDILRQLETGGAGAVFGLVRENLPRWTFPQFKAALAAINGLARDPLHTGVAVEALTLLNDRRYGTGNKKRNHVLHLIRLTLSALFSALPGLGDGEPAGNPFRLVTWEARKLLRAPLPGEQTLVIDTRGFPAEGIDCDSSLIMDAYFKGWRHFITFHCSGQRFAGCGLGPDTEGVTLDVYDSSGDYLASGIDGLTLNVHGNAQDQVAQIIKRGTLVIHGDTGQTFMYGAKGGTVYVLGSAAGRPLINSVGRPRVVINGTCLDFLAESFMAGDVFKDGGFVILNGIGFDGNGRMVARPRPYPGSNLFSLASGGAIYLRDPGRKVDKQQLNGGEFVRLTPADWDLIRPYLEENERHFGVKVDDLLTVDGVRCEPAEVYRKVTPVAVAALTTKNAGPAAKASPPPGANSACERSDDLFED